MMRLFLVISLIIVASVAVLPQGDVRLQSQVQAQVEAQTPNCGNFETATGQPGWVLVSGPGVGGPMAPVNVSPYPGWAPPIGSSSWVSVDANRGKGRPAGDYTYEYTFCVCRPEHCLKLALYADNCAKVYLNGGTPILATPCPTSFHTPPKTVSYCGPKFVMGTNTLRIVVHDDGVVTGLDAVLSVTGAREGCCR